MQVYRVKTGKLTGAHWKQVSKKAVLIYKKLKQNTKRTPYIKSAYFNNQKVFLSLYWQHLHEKTSLRDKVRRVKFFPCAIELIQKSKSEPESKENPNQHKEILHRFYGMVVSGELFCVQIKENKNADKKWFMSAFPFYK